MSATKIRNEQLNISDGWIPALDTWTYASATTFTIAGVDRTAMFPKGTKIKLTQTTGKYFYVVSSAFSTNTTIAVTGGSDYSLANATITSPYYSYASDPQGFPSVFNYTATAVSDGGSITSYVITSHFKLVGATMYFKNRLELTNNGTGSVGITISLPLGANPDNHYPVYGFNFATGEVIGGYIGNTTFNIKKYNNTYPGATGSYLVISGFCEID